MRHCTGPHKPAHVTVELRVPVCVRVCLQVTGLAQKTRKHSSFHSGIF